MEKKENSKRINKTISQNLFLNDYQQIDNITVFNNNNNHQANQIIYDSYLKNYIIKQININKKQNNNKKINKSLKLLNKMEKMNKSNKNLVKVCFDEEIMSINLINIFKGRETRTTIMIKNIPNRYNCKNMLEEINQRFYNKYDIFYLPIDYESNFNLGFAFINFVDSMHILMFYEHYKGKKWQKFKSGKICDLAYGKIQGKQELIQHFENSAIMQADSEDKKPLILQTPKLFSMVEIPLKFLDFFLTIYPKSTIYTNPETDSFYFSLSEMEV